MGLIPLFRATGDDKYVRLAKFFLDERGNAQSGRTLYGEYAQDHVPVKSQTRAIGHCVRATYLYNPLTDIVVLTGDTEYAQAVERIWEDAVTKRTYLTGGIGSDPHHEAYGDDYDLPNLACWNEICAAVGNTWWNHRMFLLNQNAKYLDVAERILYNGLLAGVSLSGDRFLYQTPLKTYGSFARQPRFGPNCCPPNITRFLASMGNLIYATDKKGSTSTSSSAARLGLTGRRTRSASNSKQTIPGTAGQRSRSIRPKIRRSESSSASRDGCGARPCRADCIASWSRRISSSS